MANIPGTAIPADLLEEIRQRLIHIEQKSDTLMERLDAGVPAASRAHPDQPFGNITYAQFGEDLIIVNLFHMLGVTAPSYIDIGAHHPFNISNTALLYQRGSRGINVEANPNLIEAFRRHRPEDINLGVGVGPEPGSLDFYFIDDWSGRNTFSREAAEAFVRENPQFRIDKVVSLPVMTLDELIARHANGRFPDLLTIDVEGLDLPILRATMFNSDRPTVICVEAVSGGDTDCGGALGEVLRERGYVLYVRTVGNLIYVHRAAAQRLAL